MTRFCLNLGFFDRPLVAGMLWGLWSGSFSPALPLAVFYELFWLDLFAVGTYLPPNALLPLLCLLTLAQSSGLAGPWPLSALALLLLPLAHLGAWVEKLHRLWQVGGYNRLLRHYRMGRSLEGASSWALAFSLIQLFFMNFCLFFVVVWGCDLLLKAFLPFIPAMDAPFFSWTVLWAVGALGGLLALRIKPGFVTFALLSAALLVYGFITGAE